MAAANTDLLRKYSRRWVGQIGAGGVADASVTTIPLSSTTNLATDTAVTVVIDRVDSSGTSTPSLEETVIGVVSGSNLVTCTRGVEGTAQAHSAGAVVEVLVTSDSLNDMIDHLLVGHTQLGAHIASLPLTTPKITTAIHDANGNEVIKTPATTSAVNEITVTNSITACDVLVSATGGDSNISLRLHPKGSGTLKLGTANLQWPNADGSANHYLKTDGAGVLSFAAASGSTDGWTTDSGSTWTYASATTINVADGTLFVKGTRIKLTQTTAKYFVVVGISGNVITVTGGTDYTVANAAITTQQYSHQASPVGYPGSFAYTPTVTSEGGTFTTTVPAGKFRVISNTCFLSLKIGVTTVGTATGGMDITVPITADAANYYAFTGFNNGVGKALAGEVNTTSLIRIKQYDNTQPATTGGQVAVHGMYNF
jgi:hypothetical protein